MTMVSPCLRGEEVKLEWVRGLQGGSRHGLFSASNNKDLAENEMGEQPCTQAPHVELQKRHLAGFSYMLSQHIM